MKKILIKNKDKEFLSGILEGTSKNLIIFCHGSRSNKDSSFLKYLSNKLKTRYSTFRFDFSGNGESEGALEESTYLKEISDIDSIVNYFTSKNYQIFSIFGHSKGATDLFLYSQKYPLKSKSFIAFAPRFNLLKSQEYALFKKNKEAVLKKGFYTYPSKNAKQKITKKYISQIKKIGDLKKSKFNFKVPILLFHGNCDKTIPIKDSIEFIKKNPSIKLIKIANENHCFKKSMNSLSILNIIIQWLKKV